jgi:hypothetical protein
VADVGLGHVGWCWGSRSPVSRAATLTGTTCMRAH